MDRIATEAGITKPILYKHFGDKGGLYQALAERYVRALMAELRAALSSESEPSARIATTIDAYLSFVEREREAYRFLMHRAVGERPEAQAAVTDFIRQLAEEIAVTLREELQRLGLDPGGATAWAHGMVGMVQLAGDWWLEQSPMPRTQLVDYLSVLLWRGFSRLQAPESTNQAAR
jgi:AcrR family transcriptional regulator